MKEFIDHLTERNFQNRMVGFIENGSWAPQANRIMKKMLEGSKDLAMAKAEVSIKSSMNDANVAEMEALAEELCGTAAEAEVEEAPALKKYICGICCYEYEGESLPADYVCPLCKCGPEEFTLAE
jgi:rubrerythrin